MACAACACLRAMKPDQALEVRSRPNHIVQVACLSDLAWRPDRKAVASSSTPFSNPRLKKKSAFLTEIPFRSHPRQTPPNQPCCSFTASSAARCRSISSPGDNTTAVAESPLCAPAPASCPGEWSTWSQRSACPSGRLHTPSRSACCW